jgi:nitrite reductase (NADH) small subunit
MHDKCPHKGGPLSQGIVHGKRVTCPLHGWNIGLEDGHAVAPDVGCLHKVEISSPFEARKPAASGPARFPSPV